MRTSMRFLVGALSAITLSGALTGCYMRERRVDAEERERREEWRQYRHERWNNEDIYRREDGRWYVRRNNEWVIRPEIHID